MITFHYPLHHLHAPAHEFFRGERVPCFEKPARADYVEARLTERGHAQPAQPAPPADHENGVS